MIVLTPIGAVKIGKQSHPLTVGKKVPEVVLEFWKKTKQIDALVKAKSIGEKADVKSVEPVSEKKKGSDGGSIFPDEK
jgi:hypothetical protein